MHNLLLAAVAIVNVTLIDGSGGPARPHTTVLVENDTTPRSAAPLFVTERRSSTATPIRWPALPTRSASRA